MLLACGSVSSGARLSGASIGCKQRTACALVALFIWALATSMPSGPRRNAAAERERIARLLRIQTRAWTVEELAVLSRCERLRTYGADDAAADLLVRECGWPSEVKEPYVSYAAQLDMSRWYRAFVGSEWDGNYERLRLARERAVTRRRRLANSPGLQRSLAVGARAYRSCHLLVEPLDQHPNLTECQDYTRHVGWPDASDVRNLDWDNPNAFACAYCDALLLPSEAVRISGAVNAVCGNQCCAKG